MAKNSEAKIKFTAETGEFNKAINKAESELKVLRSELKLNETQMKNTGTSVEGLEKSQKLLTAQLKEAQSKTEALRGKLDKAIEIYGEGSSVVANYKRAVANAKIEEENITKKIADCTAKLKQQADAAKDTATATDKLTDKMDDQQTELTKLKKKYSDLVIEGKETSDEAERLAREISDLSSELKQSKDAFSDAAKKADKLDNSLEDAGDAAENAGDGFTVTKGIVADLASEAIQLAISKVSEFISYLKELPEATRELRQDLATLDTSFQKQGFTVEQAKDTWTDLYTVFGEDDRAVEAANHISKMSKNQEDLNNWVIITQGVWGTYQDSLPVEGLAEASNETAKTGQVTGVLADALNWSSEAAQMFAGYMSEDVTTAEDAFNEALKECTTEEERQALITETLTKLYGDAATEYEKASGAQLDAKEATAENTLAQAELAEVIEPVTTAWTNMKTELLTAVVPAVEKVSGVLIDCINWMKEHPKIVGAVTTAAAGLAGALGTVVVVFEKIPAAYTTVKTAFTNLAGLFTSSTASATGAAGGLSKVGAALGTISASTVAVIAAIAAVVAAFISLWKNNEEFRTNMKNIWNDIKTTFDNFCGGIVDRLNALGFDFESITDVLSTIWKGFCDLLAPYFEAVFKYIGLIFETASNIILGVLDIFIGLFTGNWEQCWDGIKGVFMSIWNGIYTWAKDIIFDTLFRMFEVVLGWFGTSWSEVWTSIKNFFINTWNSIKTTATNVWNAIKDFFVGAWNGIKTTFTNIWTSITSFLSNTWETIKSVVSVGVQFIGSILDAAFQIITLPFRFIWENCKEYVFAAWEWIKSKVTTAINAVKDVISQVMNTIKTVITTVWNAIKDFFAPTLNAIKSVVTTAWNGVKTAITNAVNAVKTKVTSIWNTIKSTTSTVFNSVKSVATNAWNNLKNSVTNVVNSVKTKVSSVWNSIKSTTSNVFNSVKSTATNVWKNIKSAITKPIEEAKTKVKSVIDAIKGFFDNLKLKFPNIKMPHFKITGEFSLEKRTVPKLSIEWYAKAMNNPMILSRATIFGQSNGRLLGGGEAGNEMIGGVNTVMSMIQNAVDRSIRAFDVSSLVAAVEDLANRPIRIDINGREFALATASDTDNVNGLRNSFTGRGLVFE